MSVTSISLEPAYPASQVALVDHGAQSSAIDALAQARAVSQQIVQRTEALYPLAQISEWTGGYVQLSPELDYMPVVIGSDGKPVVLYRIVESFDEFLDIDRVLKAFPTLSFSHINSAIAFLRKVTQINSAGRDLDLEEEERDFGDAEFVKQLTEALDNIENISRVYPKPD